MEGSRVRFRLRARTSEAGSSALGRVREATHRCVSRGGSCPSFSLPLSPEINGEITLRGKTHPREDGGGRCTQPRSATRPATRVETPPGTWDRLVLVRVGHTPRPCVQSLGRVRNRASRVRGGGEGLHTLPAYFCICERFHNRPHGQPGAVGERAGGGRLDAPGTECWPSARCCPGRERTGPSSCPPRGCLLLRGPLCPGHPRGGPASSGPRGTGRSPPNPLSHSGWDPVPRGTSSFRRTSPNANRKWLRECNLTAHPPSPPTGR